MDNQNIKFRPWFISRSSFGRIFWFPYFTYGVIELELDESGIKFKQNKIGLALIIAAIILLTGSLFYSQISFLFLPIIPLIAFIIPPLILFRSIVIPYQDILEVKPTRLLERYFVAPKIFILKGVFIKTSKNRYFIRGINAESFIEKVNITKN